MPDIEKVLKGLNHCGSTWMCNGCPYEDYSSDNCQMYDDVLALLREHEPVKPVWYLGPSDPFFHCGACNKELPSSQFNFCPWCGKKVMWYDAIQEA